MKKYKIFIYTAIIITVFCILAVSLSALSNYQQKSRITLSLNKYLSTIYPKENFTFKFGTKREKFESKYLEAISANNISIYYFYDSLFGDSIEDNILINKSNLELNKYADEFLLNLKKTDSSIYKIEISNHPSIEINNNFRIKNNFNFQVYDTIDSVKQDDLKIIFKNVYNLLKEKNYPITYIYITYWGKNSELDGYGTIDNLTINNPINNIRTEHINLLNDKDIE